MSYCRSPYPESDLYVIGSVSGFLECFGAGWKLEEEKPVHRRITVPSWHTVDADGNVVEYPELPGDMSEASLDAWRATIPPHRGPVRIVESGETHEDADIFLTKSRAEMIEHMLEHRAAGHKVPEYALDRLRQEIAEEGDTFLLDDA